MRSIKHISVKIEQLYLDPNNPRFPKDTKVEKEEILSHTIQEWTENELNSLEDISNLKDSIISAGYVPLNSILVKEIEKNKYLVIEGNCRTLALREIKRENGKTITLKDEVEESIEKITVALMDEDVAFEYELLGITHLIGTKAWKPYSQAKFLVKKIESGMKAAEAGEKFGLKVPTTLNLVRSYYAYKQLEQHPLYKKDRRIQPELFSFFMEVLKKPVLRQWLSWDEETKIFANEETLEMFYKWIIGDEEGKKRITMAIQVRKLPLILKHDDLVIDLDDGTRSFDAICVEAQGKSESTTWPEIKEKLKSSKKLIGFTHKNIKQEHGKEIIKLLESIKTEAQYHIDETININEE
tara:strand:- start:1708 stop:2769 length:1062 start_codon:yes stop_codon:yes gene_type:complete